MTAQTRALHLARDVDEVAITAQDAQPVAFDLNKILRVEPAFGIEWTRCVDIAKSDLIQRISSTTLVWKRSHPTLTHKCPRP